MAEMEAKDEEPPKGARWWLTLIICVLLALGGWALVWLIDSTEPEAERSQASKKTAMLVEVVEAEAGDFRPRIEALGEVRPSREVRVGVRVGGQVISRSPGFTPGGLVARDEVLLRIDPADYEKMLAQRKSEYEQQLAELDLEEGRQTVAELDLHLLDESLEVDDKALVLREPQLKSAKAAVALAETAVDQARLDLQRTGIRAPFDALVMTREADEGTQLSAGDEVGRLVGLDEYWVVATVPMTALRWIQYSDDEGNSQAELADERAWGVGKVRKGKVERLLGELDQGTRLARVIIAVKDPQGRSSGEPGLILGALMTVTIEGEVIENVVRLPRDFVRKNDTAWVDDGGQLAIRDLGIVFEDSEYAYVSTGLSAGDRVVTTSLSSVTEGAPLRTEEESNDG